MNTNTYLTALGPLATLQNDPEITTIVVDAPDYVYVAKTGTTGQLEETDVTFASTEAL